MKIKVLKHNSVKIQFNDDLQKVKDYFISDFVKQFIPLGIPLEFEIVNTDIPRNQVPQTFFTESGTIMYLYDKDAFSYTSWGTTFQASSKLRCIYLATNQIEDSVDYTWRSMAHEIVHSIFLEKNIAFLDPMDSFVRNGIELKYYKDWLPFEPDGNYAEAFKRLSPYFRKYLYFNDNESTGGGFTVANLNPELVKLLDKIRGECGFALKINSGFRTVAQNTSLSDAVGDSAHLSGNSVDIAITDSQKRFKLLKVALANGITRVGIAKTFLHIDISKTLPNSVTWLY